MFGSLDGAARRLTGVLRVRRAVLEELRVGYVRYREGTYHPMLAVAHSPAP